MNTQPITLNPGQHWSPRDARFRRRALTIRCHSGTLWITGRGVAGDRLLRAGDSLVLDDARRLLVGALDTAAFDVTGSGPLPAHGDRRLTGDPCPAG